MRATVGYVPDLGLVPLDDAAQRLGGVDEQVPATQALSAQGSRHRALTPIESVFAMVRHRTVRTKGALSPITAKLMVFKLVMAASKSWRRLKGENQLPEVVAGVSFRNGTEVIALPYHRAA